MAYATTTDVQNRMLRTMSNDELSVCGHLLDDCAFIIDSYNADAECMTKMIVSCKMVIRALGDGSEQTVPIGATQGSMSALGYSQSWTIGSSGAVGELYLTKVEKKMLGAGNHIGSYSPVEALVSEEA